MIRLFIYICFRLVIRPVSADDLTLLDTQVMEEDASRLAPNDHGPTLYKVKCTVKESSLWIEGADTNYEWLTIIPFGKIDSMTYRQTEKGMGLGKALLLGGPVWGTAISRFKNTQRWLRMDWAGKKASRSVRLLLPKDDDVEFRSALETRSGQRIRVEDVADEVDAQQSPEDTEQEARVTVAEAPEQEQPHGPRMQELKITDMMTVADYRNCGLAKLSQEEMQNLERWIGTHFALGDGDFMETLPQNAESRP